MHIECKCCACSEWSPGLRYFNHTTRNTRDREYHTQLAKMSFDKICDLTAGVYFYFLYYVFSTSSLFPARWLSGFRGFYLRELDSHMSNTRVRGWPNMLMWRWRRCPRRQTFLFYHPRHSVFALLHLIIQITHEKSNIFPLECRHLFHQEIR